VEEGENDAAILIERMGGDEVKRSLGMEKAGMEKSPEKDRPQVTASHTRGGGVGALLRGYADRRSFSDPRRL
jgi:hypothetical protein